MFDNVYLIFLTLWPSKWILVMILRTDVSFLILVMLVGWEELEMTMKMDCLA